MYRRRENGHDGYTAISIPVIFRSTATFAGAGIATVAVRADDRVAKLVSIPVCIL